jgi:hypothetical protein
MPAHHRYCSGYTVPGTIMVGKMKVFGWLDISYCSTRNFTHERIEIIRLRALETKKGSTVVLSERILDGSFFEQRLKQARAFHHASRERSDKDTFPFLLLFDVAVSIESFPCH